MVKKHRLPLKKNINNLVGNKMIKKKFEGLNVSIASKVLYKLIIK